MAISTEFSCSHTTECLSFVDSHQAARGMVGRATVRLFLASSFVSDSATDSIINHNLVS